MRRAKEPELKPQGEVIAVKNKKWIAVTVCGVLLLLFAAAVMLLLQLTPESFNRTEEALYYVVFGVFSACGIAFLALGGVGGAEPNALIYDDREGYYIRAKRKYFYFKYDEIEDVFPTYTVGRLHKNRDGSLDFSIVGREGYYHIPNIKNLADAYNSVRSNVPMFKGLDINAEGTNE